MTTLQPEQEPAGQPEPGAVENPPETQIIILSNQLKELEQDYKHKTEALIERVADLERLDHRLDGRLTTCNPNSRRFSRASTPGSTICAGT